MTSHCSGTDTQNSFFKFFVCGITLKNKIKKKDGCTGAGGGGVRGIVGGRAEGVDVVGGRDVSFEVTHESSSSIAQTIVA